MKDYVYLVNARTHYEGDSTLMAFTKESDAKALADKCRKLDEIEPRYPDGDAPYEQWQAAEKKHEAWKKKHPAGMSYDYYEVERIEIRRAM
jgi:hypothetical protein